MHATQTRSQSQFLDGQVIFFLGGGQNQMPQEALVATCQRQTQLHSIHSSLFIVSV